MHKKQNSQTSFTRWCYYKTIWLDYFSFLYIVALWDGNEELSWDTPILHWSYYYFVFFLNWKQEVNPKQFFFALLAQINVVCFIIIVIHLILSIFFTFFYTYVSNLCSTISCTWIFLFGKLIIWKKKKKKMLYLPTLLYIYISFVIFIYSRGFWLLLFLLSFLPIDVRKTTLIFFIFPFSLKKLIMFLCIVFLIYLYYKKKNPFTLFFFILAFYLFHFQETWQYLWQTKGGENKRAKHLLHDDVITKQYDLTTFSFCFYIYIELLFEMAMGIFYGPPLLYIEVTILLHF